MGVWANADLIYGLYLNKEHFESSFFAMVEKFLKQSHQQVLANYSRGPVGHVLCHVFPYLALVDLVACNRVCHEWRAEAIQDYLWFESCFLLSVLKGKMQV